MPGLPSSLYVLFVANDVKPVQAASYRQERRDPAYVMLSLRSGLSHNCPQDVAASLLFSWLNDEQSASVSDSVAMHIQLLQGPVKLPTRSVCVIVLDGC